MQEFLNRLSSSNSLISRTSTRWETDLHKTAIFYRLAPRAKTKPVIYALWSLRHTCWGKINRIRVVYMPGSEAKMEETGLQMKI